MVSQQACGCLIMHQAIRSGQMMHFQLANYQSDLMQHGTSQPGGPRMHNGWFNGQIKSYIIQMTTQQCLDGSREWKYHPRV